MGSMPSKPDPSQRVQVISTGLPRTGTESMTLALAKLLNGPVSHAGVQCARRTDGMCRPFLYFLTGRATLMNVPCDLNGVDYTKRWVQAFNLRAAGETEKAKKIAKELTAGYAALTDAPHSTFALELADIYPDAKILVVERNPDSWWGSISHVSHDFASQQEVQPCDLLLDSGQSPKYHCSRFRQ
jgi:hypothetical protein